MIEFVKSLTNHNVFFRLDKNGISVKEAKKRNYKHYINVKLNFDVDTGCTIEGLYELITKLIIKRMIKIDTIRFSGDLGLQQQQVMFEFMQKYKDFNYEVVIQQGMIPSEELINKSFKEIDKFKFIVRK